MAKTLASKQFIAVGNVNHKNCAPMFGHQKSEVPNLQLVQHSAAKMNY